MAYVKAEYLEALNKNTNQVEQVKFIPPSPEGDDLGGVSKKYIEATQKAIEELADKKITKFYASSQGNTHLPDSDKGKIQDMFLYGRSEQVQYKGKNLFDAKGVIGGSKSVSNNGITFKYDSENDIFSINGNATAEAINAYIFGGYSNTVPLFTLPSGTYTFSSTLTKCIMYSYDGTARKTYDLSSSGSTYTFATEVGITALKPANQTVGTAVNQSFNLQIEKGSTKTDFEPYTGGIPSPNPDYPQEIKAVVNPKVAMNASKNLLDEKEMILGSLTDLKGEHLISNTRVRTILGLKVTKGEKYTVNADVLENVAMYAYVNGIYNKGVSDIDFHSVPYTFTILADCDVLFVFRMKSNSVIDFGKKGNIQIQGGSTATPYEPYTEQSTTLPYTLYAIPVTTGGNITIGGKQYVADYVDVERGKLVRMCKEIDFAKTKQALYANSLTDTKESRYRYKELNLKVLADNVTYENGAGYVNRASLVNTTRSIDRKGIFSHGQGTQKEYVTLRIPQDKDAREYFTEIGGCKGVFQIATPEEIDLTQDQLQAFKSLSTNYPVTNIEVSSDQLDGYTVFNYPISMAEGWNYVKQQIGDTRDYIYDMDLQSAEAYVNSEYAVALTELEVM